MGTLEEEARKAYAQVMLTSVQRLLVTESVYEARMIAWRKGRSLGIDIGFVMLALATLFDGWRSHTWLWRAWFIGLGLLCAIGAWFTHRRWKPQKPAAGEVYPAP